MITLGNTDYTTARDTIVHEIVHQWYGDQVTPDDWRDLWMNEGMAMYLQFVWQSETTGTPLEQLLTQAATFERQSRKVNGPPATYDPRTFGEIQVYYGPALMWDEIRRRVGDDDVLGDGARLAVRTTPTAAATATTTCPGSRSRPARSCRTCSTGGCSPSGPRSSTRNDRAAVARSMGGTVSFGIGPGGPFAPPASMSTARPTTSYACPRPCPVASRTGSRCCTNRKLSLPSATCPAALASSRETTRPVSASSPSNVFLPMWNEGRRVLPSALPPRSPGAFVPLRPKPSTRASTVRRGAGSTVSTAAPSPSDR